MEKSGKVQVSVLGAGSWGTAVALALAYQGHQVLLWARDSGHVANMQQQRHNHKYLPNIAFPDNLQITADLPHALETENLLIAVPSHAFSGLLTQIKKLPKTGIAWLTKGLEPITYKILSRIVQERFGSATEMAMISGPSFAKEVATQKPTALVVAGTSEKICEHWQQLLHSDCMRVYKSQDLIGVQLCGAVKNVLAIACGISDGLEFGANSRAALITRGIAEMTQLGLKLGAQQETFHGLAGIGDLVLTCTDNQSRNRRFGLLVGQGQSIKEAQENIGQVVEGMHNAKQVYQLAHEFNIEMPITESVYAILEGKLSPIEAAKKLLQRPIKKKS